MKEAVLMNTLTKVTMVLVKIDGSKGLNEESLKEPKSSKGIEGFEQT